MRRLSPEERALWGVVAGTVRPVAGRDALNFRLPERRRGTMPSVAEAPTPKVLGFARTSPSASLGKSALDKGAVPNHNTLDATWDKRLRNGQASPDFTIDLHGETLASAHIRLNQCLHIAIRSGARLILLITGRPARDNPRLPPTSRGVIRASVGDWLAASPHASHIAAVRNAHPRHGGAGAMYLILKRAR